MKILIPIKRVIDPYVKIRVVPERLLIDAAHAKQVINPFDEIALEAAIRWKEQGIASELTVVSIGPQCVTETLRHALALGADKAVHIQTEEILSPLAIAKILRTIAMQYSPHIIIMGKQAIDDDCNQTPQMLAGLLGFPQATYASTLDFVVGNTALCVQREVDEGIETLQVELPAVISTDLRLNEPRYASLPNIMQAKRKPLESIDLASLGVEDSVNETRHEKRMALNAPKTRKPVTMVKDVQELMHYLRDIEKVI